MREKEIYGVGETWPRDRVGGEERKKERKKERKNILKMHVQNSPAMKIYVNFQLMCKNIYRGKSNINIQSPDKSCD